MQKAREEIKTGRAERAERSFPDKLFYKIGEVGKIAGVEPYVLRYWESEFPFLRPRKSKSGQRIYIKKDLETILQIKDMLYSERYTIEGVRKRLAEGAQPGMDAPAGKASHAPAATTKAITADNAIKQVKERLRDILKRLS